MGDPLHFTITREDAGDRLDRWLAGQTELSRSRLQSLINDGALTINAQTVTVPNTKLREGQEISLTLPPPVDDTPLPEDIPLDIAFEDEHLLVINKPAGMTVHPAPGSRQATLVNALLHHCTDLSGIGGVLRPGIVHRIDKDTSGLIVVAKTDRAHQGLAKQFAKHTVHRRYECFTRATPRPRSGQLVSRIARSPHDRKKMAVVRGTVDAIYASETGKHAVTNYETLKTYGQLPGAALGTGRFSHIECRLETGRTHQIRVHMAHLGCPLLGDPLYGRNRAYRTSNHPAELAVADYLSTFKRQALHARELGFIHPATKDKQLFTQALPPDMQGLKDLLETLPDQAT